MAILTVKPLTIGDDVGSTLGEAMRDFLNSGAESADDFGGDSFAKAATSKGEHTRQLQSVKTAIIRDYPKLVADHNLNPHTFMIVAITNSKWRPSGVSLIRMGVPQPVADRFVVAWAAYELVNNMTPDVAAGLMEHLASITPATVSKAKQKPKQKRAKSKAINPVTKGDSWGTW